MHSAHEFDSKLLMVGAAVKVVEGLGPEVYSLIQQYLMRVYGVSLRTVEGPGSYSLEQLRGALDNLLGDRAGAVIMEEVFIQLDEYSEALYLPPKKCKR